MKDKNSSNQKDSRDLRHCEAKNVKKRTRANKIVTGIQTTGLTASTKGSSKTYKYLDCCIYRVSHLCGRGTLSPEKLPLLPPSWAMTILPAVPSRTFLLREWAKQDEVAN